MWTIPLPTFIQISKKTKFYLNLNPYRNANFHTLNNAKLKFAKLVTPLLRGLPQMDRVSLVYTLYVKDKRLVDTNNICCIVDKFFCDTLVEAKKIVDDNYTVVVETLFRFGGITKGESRVDVTITPNPEPNPVNQEEIMKITIDQVEIEQAIKDYIGGQIAIREDQRVDIDLKAGRGENGFSASIDIVGANTPVPSAKPVEADPVAVPKTPKPRPVETPVSTSTEATSTDTAGDTQVEQTEQIEQPQTQVDEPVGSAEVSAQANVADLGVVVPKKTSLFAGLKKPVNG